MKRYLILLSLFVFYAIPAQASPFLLWSMSGLNDVQDIYVDSSGLAYVSCNVNGIKVLDLTTPTPEIIGEWNTGGKWGGDYAVSREILLQDNVLVVAQREGGTRFIDVSDPTNPQLIATIANPDNTSNTSKSARLAIEGNMLYVSSVYGGFSRIDISDIRNPKYLDTIQIWNKNQTNVNEAQGISIYGNYAFVASYIGGLSIIDISDMAKMEVVKNLPRPVGSYPGTWDVHVQDGIAYVLSQGYGVQIFDMSDINSVSLISEIKFSAPELWGPDTPPADIKFLTSAIAAISYGSLGVYLYDFSELLNPTLLVTLTADNMIALNMFLEGFLLYVAGYGGGLFVFDVSSFLSTPIPATLLLSITGISAMLYKRRKIQGKV